MISILVAIYNSEGYLIRCLESIINQTYANLEIILIDDGSTDESGLICEQYALQDNRIRVFHQENKGIGKTREVAISHAKGDYILFIDPDDWVEKDMISEMYLSAIRQDADVIVSNFFYNGDNYEYVSNQYFPKSSNEELIRLVVAGDFHGSYCNKLIRSELLKNSEVKFPSINFSEDQLVVLQLLLQGKSFKFIDRAFYHYYQHTESETNRINEDFVKNKLVPYHKILNELLSYDPMLLKTSYFFFYSWLFEFKLNPKLLSYLMPKSARDIKISYLSTSRKIKLLKQLHYPVFVQASTIFKHYYEKLWKRLTFPK